MNFDRFIGIDWSGAKDPRRGLQIAQCFQGRAVPQIVRNKKSNGWRRRDVLDWLVEINKEKVIAGFDFAFAYPYCDERAYFPGHHDSPKSYKSLWKAIDSICGGDFYGGPFYKKNNAKFSDYLLYSTYTGKKYKPRMRITDNLCAKLAGNPSSVFKCVGPESVGIGSVAGMRFLHEVSTKLNKDFSIWPFHRENQGRSVIVEIFPRFFYILAGANPREWQNRSELNNALKYYDSEELPSNIKIESEDQIDAIISAAAIRYLANNPKTWQPAGLNNCARAYEGWIFGLV
ncbi:MAG: hypothetical protein M1438_01630 [Deltaproteobacteria bacterium]|nr:hypothetical protein [Deltaproteobacteria bacterium]